jgi:flagellar motor protein MotB
MLLIFYPAGNLNAQDIRSLKDRAKEKVLEKVNKEKEDAGNENEVNESEESSGDEQSEQTDTNEDQEDSVKKATVPQQEKLQSFTKYDFVPGDQVIFFDDFSQDATGDFPAMWVTDGSGEVRTLNKYPGNWLYASSEGSVYCLMKDLALPENFILEFDVVPEPQDAENDIHAGFSLSFYNTQDDFLVDDLVPGTAGFHVSIEDYGWNVQGFNDQEYTSESRSEIDPIKVGELNHIIVWIQKRRLRIYYDGKKVIDGATVLPANARYNRFRFSKWGFIGFPYFSSVRITTAAPDTRSKLLTDGKLISYGIYFDSGKDIVKPESFGALNEIATVMKENPGVRVKIAGHTDSDGSDQLNLDLSKRRALAVKKALSTDFGIDSARLESEGAGESQPVAPNTSAEGKAKNRRVEFIKL